MANAQLQPIYDRLNGIENYKPYTAGVFADWSLEAGDIVTTVRDGVEYSSPIHVSSLQWNGRQKMDIESNGEKTRGSVAKMSIRSYNSSNGGGNGYRGYRIKNKQNKVIREEFEDQINGLYGYLEMTASHFETEFVDQINGLYGYLEMTASHIETDFTDQINGLYGYLEMTASHFETEFTDQINRLYGYLEMTASHFETEFVDQKNQLYGYVEATASHWESVLVDESASIRSLVRQTASSWESRVEGVVDEDGNITAASISVAINADGSHAKIEADHIDIDGLVTALAAKNIGVGSLTVEGQTTFKNYVYSEAAISCEEDISAASFTSGLVTLKVADITFSGNTMTVSYCDGRDPVNFSKATSLSGAWSGSLPKTLTITASPQGNTYQVQFDGTYSATRTNLEVSLGGSISIETVMGAKMLSIPVNISRLTGTSSAPDIVYQTNISAAYNALLETRSVSANGTYTPRSNYIGIGSIKVTVPNTMLVDAATGTATIGTGGSSSLTFSAGITYSSATHTYIAKAIVDGVDMEPRRAASGLEAYNAGVDEGNKNRHSIVLFSETTGTPTITVAYGKTYKAQSQYQAYDGTWHDDYKEIFAVPPDRWQEGYDYAAQTITPESHTKKYSLYCSKASVIGSGQSDYVFEGTYQTGRFSKGNSYDFWR